MAFHRFGVFLPGLAALLAPGLAAAEPPTCVAIQRGALGEVADASLVSFGSLADRSWGEMRQLHVGKSGSVEARALLRFDVGEIPPRATIEVATVTLGEPSDTGSRTIDVHRSTAPWDEHLATWSRSAAAFDPAVDATFVTRGPAGGGAVSFDLTALVRSWVGGAPNHGLLLASRDPGLTELCSSEYPEAKQRPRLEVCFTPPPPSNALWSSRVEGDALATDSAGNAIVTGGDGAVAVTKLDPSGQVLWSRRFESPAAYASAVAVDRANNILITGAYRDFIDLGAGLLDNTLRGQGVTFVAKLDPAGHTLWSRSAAGSSQQFPRGIAVDSAGEVIVTGSFQDGMTFTTGDPTPGPGAYEDIFLAKFSPTGELRWEKHFGGEDDDRTYGIAIGRGDDILLTGLGGRSLDFGGGPVEGVTAFDLFVARLAPDGSPRWGRSFGEATGQTIAVDATDHIVVVGNRSSVLHVGGGPSAPPAEGTVVIKLDDHGGDVWSKRFVGAGRNAILVEHLAVDAAGNILLTGSMESDIDLGGGPLKHVGESDIFLAKLGPDGEHLRSMAFGDLAAQAGDAVALDPSGKVLLLAGGAGRSYYGPGLFVDEGRYVTKLGW